MKPLLRSAHVLRLEVGITLALMTGCADSSSGQIRTPLDEACNSHHRGACIELGRDYMQGRGVQPDPEQARQFMKLAEKEDAPIAASVAEIRVLAFTPPAEESAPTPATSAQPAESATDRPTATPENPELEDCIDYYHFGVNMPRQEYGKSRYGRRHSIPSTSPEKFPTPPDDIVKEGQRQDHQCSVDNVRSGNFQGVPAILAHNRCLRDAAERFCKERPQRIAREGDPNSAQARQGNVKKLTELQKSNSKAPKAVITLGRDAIRKILKAPTTARFSEDKVVLQCPSGVFFSQHTVDAQNSFGAMIRGQHCAVTYPAGKKGMVIVGGGDCSDITVARMSLAQGNTALVEHFCTTYEPFLK